MEPEARDSPLAGVNEPDARDNLVGALRQRLGELGGVDLELPRRTTKPRAAKL